jgi:hypothetical protein
MKIMCPGLLWLAATACSSVALAQLSFAPSAPSALDTVRLRWTHAGCTNPDSARVTMQAGLVTVTADRTFIIDCGTILGYYDEYTVGRLPAGEYDVQLVVNPPPPTLGPSVMLGPVHLSVGAMPPTGSLLPHDNYADGWWNPDQSGWAFNVQQSGATLVAVWSVYGANAKPTWYTLQPGAWVRDVDHNLRYTGIIYQTTGPYWGGPYDPAAVTIAPVGVGSFIPLAASRARFDYTINGVSGSTPLVRFVF